ncbi:MAG: hypothetical protein RL033_7259, partial [Pseudomonadota bacterium]
MCQRCATVLVRGLQRTPATGRDMASESSSSSRRGRQFLTSHGQFRFGTCGLLLGALALAACSDEARHLSATEPDGADPDGSSGAGPDGASGTEPEGTATALVSGVKPGEFRANWLRTNGDDDHYGVGKQVLRQQGDRLYALSGETGLAVLDLSDPSAPRVVGRHFSLSNPFELLPEDGIVLALHDGWQSYVCEQGSETCSWRAASRLQALDTRDATQIALLSDLSLPGALTAVHRAGNVLYVVSTEQECWGCEAERNYTVTSFDVHDPANLQVLDQLRFFTRSNAPAPLPVFVPDAQRLYLANRASDPRDPSSVQVVDISDPGGALVEGARFDIQAALSYPSQLQEASGILRIVNWPAGAINDEVQPPIAQAFRVSSSSDVQAAGSLRLQLTNPLFQGDVRWQGTRAYLSMARQVIALDLDDPDQPQQVATIELAENVNGMELQGDRLLVVSSETTWLDNVQLSSFDVSTPGQPTLLETKLLDRGLRHEASPFTFFPEQGLLALPLSVGNFECNNPNGIALVDMNSEGLLPRGIVADASDASLLFLHRDRLFGVGARYVETFDLDNRDAPVASGRLDLLQPSNAVQPLGEDLLLLSSDLASGRTLLQVMAPPASPGTDAAPLGQLALGMVRDVNDCLPHEAALGRELLSKGEHVYVPFVAPIENELNSLAVSVSHVDLSDHAAPRLVGEVQIGKEAIGITKYRLLQQTDDTLLIGLMRSERIQGVEVESAYFDILDVSNPAQPQLATRFDLPASLLPGWGEIPGGVTLEQRGRWRDSESRALLTDGNLLITQHRVPVADSSNAAAYYLDRLDLSDPYHPHLLPPINIPGAVVHFNQQTGDVLTFDTEPTTESTSIGARTLHWLSVSGDRA